MGTALHTARVTPSDATRIAYGVSEAAVATGLGRTTLYSLINSGALPSVKVAGRRLIRRTDLEALVTRPDGAGALPPITGGASKANQT